MDFRHLTPDSRILIIDDSESSAAGLARLLQKAGYAICITMTDPKAAVERFCKINPDIVLLDLHMEPISGIQVLQQINALVPAIARPPILVITGDTTPEAKHDALLAGATDFLAKPLDPVEVMLRIQHLLSARTLFQQCQVYSQGLERLVDRRTADLQKQTRDLELALAQLQETQQQILQQERLRALGTMASGIAHDLNNGLSMILGYGDMLLNHGDKFPHGSKERAFLEHIVQAGQDNAELVKRLREFYRPTTSREERQAIDLNEIVQAAIAMTAPKWQTQAQAKGKTIRIRTELHPVPIIAGAPSELREVLANLLFNAVEAMPQGGEISLETSARKDHVRLRLTDTGVGMNAEARQRCFEPFYTTKDDGGSGLGLAMSYGIVRRHGGTLTVESKLGAGATFTIELPIPGEPIQTSLSRPHQRIRPLRVLVVDDHPAIREIVSAYLAEDRHIVETAADAIEAQEKFRSGTFDLVITDRAMPEVNGDELAAAIKEISPHKPVIMLTGFADVMKESGQDARNVDFVVSKPARLEDLRAAILQVMDH